MAHGIRARDKLRSHTHPKEVLSTGQHTQQQQMSQGLSSAMSWPRDTFPSQGQGESQGPNKVILGGVLL